MKTKEDIYNSVIDAVVEELERVKADILANMEAKDINASGRTSRSIGVQRYEAGVRLGIFPDGERVAPMETLETGRPGGPVPRGFTAILYQWSLDKGIHFAKDSDRRSFAYLLGRRIAREGTIRFHVPQDVYTTAVNAGIERIKKRIATDLKVWVTENLHNQLFG